MKNAAWLLLATLLFGLGTLAYPVGGWDVPTYSYIASTILDGGTPYRDAWDLKGPGIFFAYALQQLLFGRSALGIRLFDLLWQFGTALILCRLGMHIFQKQSLGLFAGLIYLLTYFARNLWDWMQPDSLVALPLALAVASVLRAWENDGFMSWLSAGFLVGVAVLFKIPFPARFPVPH